MTRLEQLSHYGPQIFHKTNLEFREIILKATVYNLRRSVRYP